MSIITTVRTTQRESVFHLQKSLFDLGFDLKVDGAFGPKTEAVVKIFQTVHGLEADGIVGKQTLKKLEELSCKHLSELIVVPLRANVLAKHFTDWKGGDRTATIQAIKHAAQQSGITDPAQIAYILATVEHETADSFQPVRECYYLGEPAAESRRRTLRYYPYYGRGYVQLTWKDNYQKYSKLTGFDLVNQPDLVMEPAIALFILIDGMKHGRFSGRKLADYTGPTGFNFTEARRIINVMDKANHIAELAQRWMA